MADLNAIDRDDTELRMIEAMSLALEDVNNLPWTFTLPQPPNVPRPGYALVPALLVSPDVFPAVVLVVALIALCAAAYLSWAALRSDEISRFMDEFGSRVEKYMNLAIYHPDTFQAMKEESSSRGFSVGI